MKKVIIPFAVLLIVAGGLAIYYHEAYYNNKTNNNMHYEKIKLPTPTTESSTSLEQAIENRRSVRNYKDDNVTLQELSQILWAGQGITSEEGLRAAPSAGATYPLEIYITVRKVEGLSSGVYKFVPEEHAVIKTSDEDVSVKLWEAALNQESVKQASFNIIFTAIYERTATRYGDRAERYVHMEVGHAAQNIYLQAESLGLGTVAIGAFADEEVSDIINPEKNEKPIYIMPVGRKQ